MPFHVRKKKRDRFRTWHILSNFLVINSKQNLKKNHNGPPNEFFPLGNKKNDKKKCKEYAVFNYGLTFLPFGNKKRHQSWIIWLASL